MRLQDVQDAAGLADYLRHERAALLAQLNAGEKGISGPNDGLGFARCLSDLMDSVVTRMFTLACAQAGANPSTLPIAIVATGGYGRRELCPFSDIDITFIPARDGDPQTDRVIRAMFTLVMDVCIARCGLEVGYAYRLLEDCNALDHQTTCGLLDARLLVGSERLFIQFEDAFWLGFNPTDFIFTKLKERESALAKWGRLPRVVEPQLKEGPGGLRDLQTAIWLTQARDQLVAARVRGPRGLECLVRDAKVSAEDAERLAQAKELLFRVRNALHAVTGAERDELVITRQEEVAALLGYTEQTLSPPARAQQAAPLLETQRHREKQEKRRKEEADLTSSSPHLITPSPVPPVERFMADLFPALGLIRRVADQVMDRIGNSRLMLGIGLDCKRRQIVPANDALESDDPAWLLWACELAQKYDLQMSDGIERAALSLLAQNPVTSEPRQTAEVFTQILARPGKAYPILQKMADLGILGWILPEFGPLMDLIPYDSSHDYTVGQHSLLVVRHLEALRESDRDEERAEMKRVLEELAHPEQLVLAALLHDSGKAMPGRPHAEIGEEVVEAVCARLGWEQEATANVKFLVGQHLLMAETSRLRDLNLEETIRAFTRVVDDPERLNMLYLLTYADTRAVGEGVWTQVKGRFLRELWRRASAVLYDEEPVGYDEASVARARRRLLKDLSLENLPEEEVAEHIQAMPPDYLLNQTLREITLHIGYVRRVRAGQPVVEFHDERESTYTELTVCTYDDPQPGLLAKIAGALYAADLNVHSAQVITRIAPTDRIALDTLWVDYRGRPLSPGKRKEVCDNLIAVLSGTQTVQEVLEKKRRKSAFGKEPPPVERPPLEVNSVRNDLTEALTVIEVSGPDAHGACYRVSEALSRLGWSIRSARFSSWRNEARTCFYVEGARGLSEKEAATTLARLLVGD